MQTVACLANKHASWAQFEWKEAGLSVLVPSSRLISVIGFRFRCPRTSWFWSYQGFATGNKYTVFCVRHFGGVLEPLAAIIGRCSNRAEEFLQALVGQCVFNEFRNLRRLLHISYSHQESARPLYSRLFQFIWQVWFLNPTSRAWTSGIECLSRAVVAPRLMGVLQCVNRTWHAKRWHKLWELWVNCFDVRWRHSKIFCKHVQIRALKRDTIHRDVF